MWPYRTEQEAIEDVLRLSRGMSYKNAMADLPLGGGKAVIIGDPGERKSEALFRAFGRFLDTLGGRYITAEDVGMTVADMEIIATETKYVAGLGNGGGASGDPSPVTAYGVFVGIKAAVEHKLGAPGLTGFRIAVQGLGHVGYHLCRHLAEDGATLVVTDINQDSVARVVGEFGARAVAPGDIFAADVDVFSPCALGAALNDDTIPVLKASIVAGAANNQLAEPRHDAALRDRGVLYCPDYVINAGGIINVAGEVLGNYSHERSVAAAGRIYGTLGDIFGKAESEGRPTGQVADALALQRIETAKRKQVRSQKVA